MKVGYACTPLMIPHKSTRKLIVANYSDEKICKLINDNINDLYQTLIYNNSKGIQLFRISSDIIPLGSHSINTFPWEKEFNNLLSDIGKYIINNNLRVSMHPGQYTLLNSPKKEIVEKSITDLTYHCNFLDSLNLPPNHKIILHVGGVYGNKEDAMARFINEYNSLPSNIKSRLIIENDERFFSIYDLLKINSNTKVPIIFDNLHYECFGDFTLPMDIVLKEVQKTWKVIDGDMKIHYSQQDIIKKAGAHAPTTFIDIYFDFLKNYDFSNIDMMLEVKDKDVSAIKIVNSLKALNQFDITSTFNDELEKYKLFIIEKLGIEALDVIKTLQESNDIINLYNLTDSLIYKEYDELNYKQALDRAFEYVKTDLNSKEINHFNKYYISSSYIKCKEYLKKLSDKYNLPLNKTYYFIY